MGIVTSTLAPVAIRLAWICQKLLDPKYTCIEGLEEKDTAAARPRAEAPHQQQLQLQCQPKASLATEGQSASPESAQSKALVISAGNRLPENNNSLHQENRNRRAAQLRFKTRPSSYDAALILRNKPKGAVIVAASSSGPIRCQNMRVWDVTSSSGCSSDSGSNSETDSETELRVSENVSNNEEGNTRLGMSPEEEEAFRLTVGRGHFSRSKKDRFLNHLRLEKRLNDLNNDFFGMACKNHRHTLQRRHSGDLHRIV